MINTVAKQPPVTGKGHGIDRPGRGTDNDIKRVAPVRIHVSDSAKHADLIRRPRATSGENDTVLCHEAIPL